MKSYFFFNEILSFSQASMWRHLIFDSDFQPKCNQAIAYQKISLDQGLPLYTLKTKLMVSNKDIYDLIKNFIFWGSQKFSIVENPTVVNFRQWPTCYSFWSQEHTMTHTQQKNNRYHFVFVIWIWFLFKSFVTVLFIILGHISF